MRNAGIDALRAALTILVVLHHTAITYGAIGGWFYREVQPDGTFGSRFLILFCAVNQAFFMGLFFLIAGYFTPTAVTRHGRWAYLKERLVRLGVPLLIFGFVLGPFTIALAATAKDRPFLSTLLQLWSNGRFESGPLWFAQALLLFGAGYLIWTALPIGSRRAEVSAPASRVFPSNGVLALAVVATGCMAFALRLLWPVGTQVWGLQLGYFASYIVLFVAGCLASGTNALNQIPPSQRRLWGAVAGLAVPVLPLAIVLAFQIPALQGDANGGWNVPAVVYAFWEPLVAWGIILALLHHFQHRYEKLTPIWSSLSRRAYAVFVIHPPVLVAIALAWRAIPAPHLVKFVATGALTCLVCFWLAGLLLKIPYAKRVI